MSSRGRTDVAIGVAFGLALGIGPAAAGAQQLARTDSAPAVAHHSAAALASLSDTLAAQHAVSRMLGVRAGYQYALVRRDTTGAAERHARWTDIMVVQTGSATLLSGGRLEGSRTTTPGEELGSAIVGGATRRVAAGDVVVIPAGMPHQMRLAVGEVVRYVVVKASETAAAP